MKGDGRLIDDHEGLGCLCTNKAAGEGDVVSGQGQRSGGGVPMYAEGLGG